MVSSILIQYKWFSNKHNWAISFNKNYKQDNCLFTKIIKDQNGNKTKIKTQ